MRRSVLALVACALVGAIALPLAVAVLAAAVSWPAIGVLVPTASAQTRLAMALSGVKPETLAAYAQAGAVLGAAAWLAARSRRRPRSRRRSGGRF